MSGQGGDARDRAGRTADRDRDGQDADRELIPAPAGEPESLRVVIADDQALMRGALRMLVESEPDLEVVGEAVDGAEAVALARSHHPDVVLMDIRMPGTDGIAATRQITADPALTGTAVLVLTTFEADEYVVRAITAGAAGFLGKGAEPHELLCAIRTVARGEALLSPAATKSLIARFVAQQHGDGGPPRAVPGLEALTVREREVLVEVAGGLSNDAIAERLGVSPLTVKTHINHTMAKLAARDRAQLVVAAYESGLVRPQPR
ncbi:response regulator [Actinacidiphila acidipaludis]|uniref:Response regulator transcription factor n=1 Tax=Actinacidiphila acidipaludis TaxID=2873382 RepID=A0ABS7Q042_9ACTN|nr:response regulator transcription factor [Streptomyces acidipaludis]MBY8876503.1 response regulator transcription factor [Streptomyces acidipaludis]